MIILKKQRAIVARNKKAARSRARILNARRATAALRLQGVSNQSGPDGVIPGSQGIEGQDDDVSSVQPDVASH